MLDRKNSPLCKFTSISLKHYMKENEMDNLDTTKKVDTPNLEFSKFRHADKKSQRVLFG
jgi:hypothetical protein